MPRPIVDPRFPARLRELRQASGMSLRELAGEVYLGKSYLHGFETGARHPSLEHAARLDSALAAGGTLAAMVTAGPAVGGVPELAERLSAARWLEDEVGAAAMLPTAAAHLATVVDLARATAGPGRPAVVQLAAQWAQFAGWLHLAAGQHRRAGVLLDRALEWAIEVGDREMVATALSFKGHAAWMAGQPGPMIGLTEAALRDACIYVGQRAYDRYQLARGYTMTGDRRGAAESLAAGADLAAESVEYTGPRPPWHYYRSRAFFDLEAGLVREGLGQSARAVELLRAGLVGLPAEMRGAEWTGIYRAALARACPSATLDADIQRGFASDRQA